MRTPMRRALCASAIAGGFTVLGFTFALSPATAAEAPDITTGEHALASGNQTASRAASPINLEGNQVTVLGNRNKAGSADAPAAAASTPEPAAPAARTTSGEDGAGSGNQSSVDLAAPLSADGNQVTVLGNRNSTEAADPEPAPAAPAASPSSAATDGREGVGSGNQSGVDAAAPVKATRNQATVLGSRNDLRSATAPAKATNGGSDDGPMDGTTSGADSVASGNQTDLAASAPITVTGNQATVIGDGNTLADRSSSPAGASGSSDGNRTTSGDGAAASGNQTGLVAALPVNVTGNQVTVIGDENSNESGAATGTETGSAAADTTSGQNGAGSGNQTPVGLIAPLSAAGNQVTVIGNGNTLADRSTSPAGASESTEGNRTTSGDGAAASGNQARLVAALPVNVTGNQVTVIGDGNSNESGAATGTETSTGPAAGDTTSGQNGAGSGNQTPVGLIAPLTTAGNQLTVIGDGNSNESGAATATETGSAAGNTTSGQNGAGSGNQTPVGLIAPLTTAGNQLTVIGDGNSNESGAATATETGPATGDTTSGQNGAGSGNQTPVDLIAPLTTGRNQLTIIGNGNTNTVEPTTPVGPGTGAGVQDNPAPGTPNDQTSLGPVTGDAGSAETSDTPTLVASMTPVGGTTVGHADLFAFAPITSAAGTGMATRTASAGVASNLATRGVEVVPSGAVDTGLALDRTQVTKAGGADAILLTGGLALMLLTLAMAMAATRTRTGTSRRCARM